MEEVAAEKPDSYFLFSAISGAVLARIDTRKQGRSDSQASAKSGAA